MYLDILSDIVKSLILMAQQGGDLPRWPLANGFTGCMDGNRTIFHKIITSFFLKILF